MVQIINDSIFKGIAGKRPAFKPSYFVLHNDAGSMTPQSYQNWLQERYNSGQSDTGFAHYYITKNAVLRAEDTYNRAWACGNPRYNNNSLSYEVCEQLKVTDAEFIENENMTMRQMAIDMNFYKMVPNNQNIKFHNEMSSTTCPARSLDLHSNGKDNDALRKHVIKTIKYYQKFGGNDVNENIKNEKGGTVKKGWQSDATGWWYVSANGNCIKNNWVHLGSNWYWATENGYILERAWKQKGGKWYWFKKGGYMAKNETLTINGKQCYFNSNGALISEIKYY